MTKKTLITAILFFIGNITFAQTIKYDDIIETINNKDYEKAYAQLFEYQQTDPEFPNTYFQLGYISYIWAKNSDPLVEFEQTVYHIRNTKLYYSLCISKLQKEEKDAKKNDKLYKTVSELQNVEKLDNIIVLDFINSQLKDIDNFDKNAHKSAELFNKMVKKYNETVDVFLSIIENYAQLKDIYLEQKSSILKSTNELILLFDSTMLFYEQYKISINNYPIKNYNQQISISPIKIYRLQGITRSNFLIDSIKIWDYKTWAKEVQNNLGTDISHFRETIILTNKELVAKEAELSNTNKFSNSYETYEIDQKTLFEIEKFDYNSFLTDLFLYRKSKIDYLVKGKRIFNDTSNYSVSNQNRAIEYYELAILKQKTDSLLTILNQKFTKETYTKHKDFFDFSYQGFEGINKYIQQENTSLNELFLKDIKKFEYSTNRDYFHLHSKPIKTTHKGKDISLIIKNIEPQTGNPNEYYTISVDENILGEKYVTGYFKTATGSSAFIAKIVNNQVEWIKNTTAGTNAYEYGTIVKATPEGCVAIIHTTIDEKNQNSVIRLNADGKQVYKKKLQNENYPRFIDYDEINDEITIAFHGTKIDNFDQTDDSLTIQKIDIASDKILWQQNFYFDANLINIIKMDTTFHLIANYSRIAIGNENFINTKSNIIIMKFSTNGKYIQSKEIIPNHFMWGTCAYKINSQTINILGYTKKSNTYNNKIKELPTPYYLILDEKSNIIFQNF
ncbi:MAG: hypothetical protein JXL97_11990 [Bacteroidales bacterium]|nr:hypothetical protein [Bacteroidales bacterium]